MLSEKEAADIEAGLSQVGVEWEEGKFEVQTGDEDIHTANERRLTEIIGPVGGKLHTGRSRNDQVILRGIRKRNSMLQHLTIKISPAQVATDTRLWLFGALQNIQESLADLMKAAVATAEANIDVIMPGFTHLQPAQTVRWGHWLLSHAAAWQRDDMRLCDLLPRVATLPLGSGLQLIPNHF